jgi:hypothetical protein
VSELAFLALLSKLFSSFFSKDENIIGIAEMLFVFLAGLPVLVPIVKLKLVQVFEKLLVEFCL